MSFPQALDELPDDWRGALANCRLLWEGGYDPALVAVRDRDHTKVPIDAWFMTFMWLFYSRDPQQLSESLHSFQMPEEWQATVVVPAPQRQLPSLRSALAWRLAHFYGVPFNDPAVTASVDFAFAKSQRAGPIGYLAATARRLWSASDRWRRFKRQVDQFPYLRFRCDAPGEDSHPLSALHGIIQPVGSEFWQVAMQPNDVGNVAVAEQVSEAMLRRRDWKVTGEMPPDWRSLIPTGFDRNFAALWPDVIEPGLVEMREPI